MSTAESRDEPALRPDDLAGIERLRREYEDPRAACIDALMLVQRHHGWVSDARLREIAERFGMAPDELEAVATFYNLIFRRPVGRHVVKVCDSVSCWIMGQPALLASLERQLGVAMGATTADGRFTLLPIVCLGHCDHAPALMVDDDLHGDVDAAATAKLLEAYR